VHLFDVSAATQFRIGTWEQSGVSFLEAGCIPACVNFLYLEALHLSQSVYSKYSSMLVTRQIP
jgi:hypothetical protein